MRKLVIVKRISQSAFLCLFVYILWSTTYPLTGAIPAEAFFIGNPLIMLATALAERVLLAGLVFSVLMLAASVLLGRFFCGWVCPLGTAIDIAGAFRKSPVLTDTQNVQVRKIKFVILALVFVCACFGIQAAWMLDPMGLAARFVSLNLIPTMTITIDGLFSWVIRIFGLYGPVYDFYRVLKSSLLGVKAHYFVHSLVIFAFFLAVIIAAAKLKRSWCRIVCPLGALYALAARFSLLKRRVEPCSQCMRCKADCPTGAIRDDLSYAQAECILCMDCVYDCPQNKTRFSFTAGAPEKKEEKGISRREFLFLSLISLGSLFGFSPAHSIAKQPRRARVIRPPAALREDEFLNRCVRCGNCMKVCITNGLQPAFLSAGMQGIWTPQLVPEIGYCEYRCTLCGNVCPTGAIPKLNLEQKLKVRLGIAKIDRQICLPWKKKKECLVCEEHCPVANKAIKLKKVPVNGTMIARPHVIPRLCIGCGICQTKCPTRPKRAIIMYPVKVTHADAHGKITQF